MDIRYTHTNIITKDWKNLADFYINVFNCEIVQPVRNLSGDWLSKGTGVKHAHIQGTHLRLPGYGENGPTLEIYQYPEIIASGKPAANKKGFSHIAFQVTEMNVILEKALKYGAKKIGELTTHPVENVGLLTFIYISDPDGNIIEIQNWN